MKIGKLKLFEHRIIGNGPQGPLLERWIIFRHPALIGLFLHKLCRSDHDRALHDHPWWFWSWIIKNQYDEVALLPSGLAYPHPEKIERRQRHGRWQLLFRPALWQHRVIIDSGRPAWTLVLVGPRKRGWGFWPKGKFCYWRKYDTNKGICEEEIIHHGGSD